MSYHYPAADLSIYLAGHAPVLDAVIVLPQIEASLQSGGLSLDTMQVVLYRRLHNVQQIRCSLDSQS